MLPHVTLSCLIVDDNLEFLHMAMALLQREGIDVVGTAATSAEALQQVSELRPAVALVDVYLGDESGLDLARQLAERPNGTRPDVILTSTYSEGDIADLIGVSPVKAFMPKAGLSGRAIRDAFGLSHDD